MVRTKICGISSLQDLHLAVKYGTDAIGLLVGQKHQSTSFISVDLASGLCRSSPPFVTTVMITHLENPDEIVILAKAINPGVIQLHSDLSPEAVEHVRSSVHQKLILKVSVSDMSAIARSQILEPHSDAILLDSVDMATDRVGGTGLVHDWTISKKIVQLIKKPVILAGGLTPYNVEAAIDTVKPWAVDVNSGVTRNGKKIEKLAREFIQNAKGQK